MNKVRWGLLSTANINKMLIPAIRASNRGELVAVASRSQEKSTAYAAEWEIPLSFGSYEALLESAEVDAVYISLPNHLHAEWSIKAMEHGKHVLCEKPFALTMDEVDRMCAVSEATGMVLTEAFMYRHHPQTKIAGEFVRAGNLGEITVVRGAFNFKMAGRWKMCAWCRSGVVGPYGHRLLSDQYQPILFSAARRPGFSAINGWASPASTNCFVDKCTIRAIGWRSSPARSPQRTILRSRCWARTAVWC